MSQESLSWLNTMVLVGMTESRKGFVDPVDPYESVNDAEGRAWHFRQNLQGAEANHYPGFIPVEDVVRRLFSWQVVEGTHESTGHIITPTGVEDFHIVDEKRKSMLRPPRALGPDDPGAILGTFGKTSYKGHDYKTWLLDKVETILDDTLGIGSAGLLRQGAQAFVSVEVPEWVTTPEGVVFKPRILAATSFDGSMSSTYQRVIANAVCDNTMRAGLREGGQRYKVRHTTNSLGAIENPREALGILFTGGDDFAAEVATLCDTTVTDDQWTQFLEETAPSMKGDGSVKTGMAATLAEKKRQALDDLYRQDERVAPWAGSAWGVVQAVNTWDHHVKTVRGKKDEKRDPADLRAERNMSHAVWGNYDQIDAETVSTLQRVLA
jgi:phage/plasmid-like protein (TIGR03299 family)